MPRSRMLLRSIATGAVILAAASLGQSGPVVPDATRPPDTVLSLGKLKRVRLSIHPPPRVLTNLGITTDAVESDWTRRLEDAGFEVGNEDGLVTLTVSIVVTPANDEASRVLIVNQLNVRQEAHIDRLDRKLTVPTYTHPIIIIEPIDSVGRAVRGNLEKLVTVFIERSLAADMNL